MKKYIPQICVFFLFSVNCFAQIKVKPVRDTLAVEDSIEYYEVEIEARQKNYMELLAGSWSIDTMRRQARAKPEALSDVYLSFLTDSSFSGSTGCNVVDGTYRLMGASIKFLTINSAKIACDRSDQEAALQRLLTQTVSAYTVEDDALLLRDGSSNVVFRGRRKKD
jgi:heat shock protein HslJ